MLYFWIGNLLVKSMMTKAKPNPQTESLDIITFSDWVVLSEYQIEFAFPRF